MFSLPNEKKLSLNLSSKLHLIRFLSFVPHYTIILIFGHLKLVGKMSSFSATSSKS